MMASRHTAVSMLRPIALALLTRGSQRIGAHVRVYHLGAETEALIVRTPFYDPEGRRVHG